MPIAGDTLDSPHGRCVVVDAPPHVDLPLHGGERALADRLGPVRRRELAIGRAAMRAALGPVGADAEILPDDRGAPILPAGWVGSISHKGGRAAAIVARAGDGFVGVDLEAAVPSRQPIEKRILTPRELHLLRDAREVTLRFAIKEAIYKAIDPIVRRYVGFTEVELDLDGDGTVDVTVLDLSRLPVEIEAWWTEREGLWLATARARHR